MCGVSLRYILHTFRRQRINPTQRMQFFLETVFFLKTHLETLTIQISHFTSYPTSHLLKTALNRFFGEDHFLKLEVKILGSQLPIPIYLIEQI